jgi:hypothetical protein
MKLVVLKNSTVEAKIDLPGVTGGQSIQDFQGRLFLPDYLGGSVYDPGTLSIKQVHSVADQFKKRNSIVTLFLAVSVDNLPTGGSPSCRSFEADTANIVDRTSQLTL